ncbi:MAG TPA: hypothetical protein VK923_15885 [Euzebyales bacterium]|nr:hypothetical protein [Euzebyales bacterium]
MEGLPESGELQRGGGQVLWSRRQILTGTSIGIGATLLFHQAARNRVDLPPSQPFEIAAEPDSSQAAPGPARVAQPPPGPARVAQPPPPPDTTAFDAGGSRAIHRVQLSDRGQPRAVARSDAGVLVMGMSSDGDPLGWLTDDGTRWVEHTLGTRDRQTAEVWGVAPYAGDFVAVGSTIERVDRRIAESGIVPGPNTQVTFVEWRRTPTVWRTSDCTAWTGQSFEDVVGQHADLIAVACDGTRLVAVGGTLDRDGVEGTGGLVLTSTDGARWRRVDLGADGSMNEGSFTGVAVGDDGWYATSVDIEGGAVWHSADASRWSVVDGSRNAFRGIALQGIGIDRSRILVAGTPLFEPEPRYFVSRTGGRRWGKAKLDVSLLAGPGARVGDLSVIAGDVVVVGTNRGVPVLEGGELHVGN